MADEVKKTEQSIADSEAQIEESKYEPAEEKERAEYNAKENKLILRPGVSAKDIEALDIADGCSVVFWNNSTSLNEKGIETYGSFQSETFVLSGDLLKAIGSKASYVDIGKNISFEYLSPQEGDIWASLSGLRSLRIRNNIGVPTNIDGTGAFQSHPTLRNVEILLSEEGSLSDNFCRGTSLSNFMVYSSEWGKEYGLKAGNNVLFGSLLETEKGISTADWNRIHGEQICKTIEDDIEFRKDVYQTQIERDKSFSEARKEELSGKEEGKGLLDGLKKAIHYEIDPETKEKKSDILVALKESGKENALSVVLDINADEKAYAQALKDVSDAINATGLASAKSYIRSISDVYGVWRSTEKRIQALTELKNTSKKSEGTYIELPSRLWAGDNFLSCRKADIHSSTDPGKRMLEEEIRGFAQKTVNAIYLACVEYKESLWKAGLKSVMKDLADDAGKVGGKTYEDVVKEKDPISVFNKLAPENAGVNKESLVTRGMEVRLNELTGENREQIASVFNFVLNTAENFPKDFWKVSKDYDKQISDIVQGGEAGHEELRKVLPSLGLSLSGHVLDLEQANLMKETENIFVLGGGSKLGDNCLCFTNCNGVYAGHNKSEYRHFRACAEQEYLKSKENIASLMKETMGIIPGSDNDKDAGEAGALRDDIKSCIVALENELKKAPSKKAQGEKGKNSKEDLLKEIGKWEDFLEKYEDYTAKRIVWEANNTEEKWLSHNSYALKEINERIKKFEEVNATTKTKDFKTHSDVYTMNRDALSDEKRAEYDKLIAERNAILVSPQTVVTGTHFLSEGKKMGNERTVIAGGEINAGHDSFSHNPEVIELHKDNPETKITADVMKKNIYNKSDIFRGRLLVGKEMLKDIFDSRHFRYMRLEEACLDIVVNLFKIVFNLTSWAVKNIEKEIRREKTKRGLYNRNVNEAKELLLELSKNGEAFLSRLTSKDSHTSEYNAALRVVGRLNLRRIIRSDEASEKKIKQMQHFAQRQFINAKNLKERADVLNKRDQLSKTQLLELYKQCGTWTREDGWAKTSQRLSTAKGRRHAF